MQITDEDVLGQVQSGGWTQTKITDHFLPTSPPTANIYISPPHITSNLTSPNDPESDNITPPQNPFGAQFEDIGSSGTLDQFWWYRGEDHPTSNLQRCPDGNYRQILPGGTIVPTATDDDSIELDYIDHIEDENERNAIRIWIEDPTSLNIPHLSILPSTAIPNLHSIRIPDKMLHANENFVLVWPAINLMSTYMIASFRRNQILKLSERICPLT